jgi:hypothetical protein
MPQNVAEFRWMVEPAGYHWIGGARLEHFPYPPGAYEWDALVSIDMTAQALEAGRKDRDAHGTWYAPPSGLFRTFADLDGSPEQALAFANRYGELGLKERTYHPEDPWYAYEQAVDAVRPARREAADSAASDITFPELPTTPPWEHYQETLIGWQSEIALMRMCVDLHDTLSKPNPENALRWHFSDRELKVMDGHLVFTYQSVHPESARRTALWWTEVSLLDAGAADTDPDDAGFYYPYRVSPCHLGTPLGSYEVRGLEVHTAEDGILQYARVMLAAMVNAHVAERIDTMLLPDPDTRRPVLFTLPNTLIGALWLQVAQAIDGHKQFRRCEFCRSWFELAPDKARADKLYCSQACRSSAYRRRERIRRSAT